MITDRELLSVEESAVQLNIKPSTVRAWILHRHIPFVKLGRRVLLRKSDLDKLIADSVYRECVIQAGKGKRKTEHGIRC